MFRQFQTVEPFLQSDDGHLHQVGDAPSTDLDVVGLRFQTCTMTHRTGGLAPVPTEHHTVLYLILVLRQHLEECVDAWLLLLPLIGGKTVPKPVFLLLGQFHIWFEDGEVVVGGMSTEPFLPFLHLLTVPAYHTTLIDRQGRVGDDQSFVDADDTTEALALRTGTCRGVEREHVVVGFLEGHAVGLELHGEIIEDVRGREQQAQLTMSFKEGGLGRVRQSGDGVLRVVSRQTVDDQEELLVVGIAHRLGLLQVFVDAYDIASLGRTG